MRNKGITLIALIITIIVLLILSAVVINLTIGENGLFSTAKYASKQYKMAETREKIALAIADIQAEYVTNNKEISMDTLVNELPNKIKDLTIEKDGEESKGVCDNFKYKIDKDYNVIIEGLDENTGGNSQGGGEEQPPQPQEPEEPKPDEDPNAKYWEFELLSDDTYLITGTKAEYVEEILNAEEIRLPEKYNGKDVTKVDVRRPGNNTTQNLKAKKLYIPKTIVNLDSGNVPNIITYLTELQEYIVDEGNARYESINGYIKLKNYPTLAYYPKGKQGSFYMPSTIQYICTYSFEESSLSSITLSSSLQEIDGRAFINCHNLKTITIPQSVKNIYLEAFRGCTNLETVYFNHTTAPRLQSNCFYKTSGVKTTFYFKNATVKNAFTTDYYNPTYGTLSTNYNW